MKAYHGNKWSGAEYDPISRRGKGNDSMHYILGGNKVGAPPPKKSGGAVAAKATTTFAKISSSLASNGAAAKAPGTVKSIGGKAAGVDPAEVTKLKGQVAELQENNNVLEKEREFYFMKLQYIEQALKLNGMEEDAIGSAMLNIMYAGEDDQVNVNEETGNIELVAEGESEPKIYSLKEVEQIPATVEAENLE